MTDMILFKKYLRENGALYVRSEIINNIKYFYLNFNEENFTITIDDEKKLILLNSNPSFYEEVYFSMDEMNSDEKREYYDKDSLLELRILLEECINNDPFKGYSLSSIDSYFGYDEEVLEKTFCITTILKNKKTIEYEVTTRISDIPYESDVIINEEGLNNFDYKLFDKNWLEDINEKVSNYNEKDLYLIIATLSSYFYKLMNNIWEDINIDPYVISDALELLVKETTKYNNNFEEWYLKWNNYFTEDNIKKYLKSKK